MHRFIEAYDRWAESAEACGGPLFDAMVEARDAACWGRPSLTPRQKRAVLDLLTRIGSWSDARWDQHLRHDVGDADANAVIAWVKDAFGIPAPPGGEFRKEVAEMRRVADEHAEHSTRLRR